MKMKTRIASVMLAAALAVGMTLPVYAQAALEKTETVYVVMNADGSVKEQTVSSHLHSDSGVSSVTDKTNLTDVVNTEGDFSYTQNGDGIVWQSDETDVYYKGTGNAELPITAQITYTLDGNTVNDPAELTGDSGHLVIAINLHNNTAETVTVNGKERQVVTPFAAVVGTMLDAGIFSNISVEHGIVQEVGQTYVAGCAVLPGVRACISDMIPEKLNTINDYLLDSVSIEADVAGFEAPSISVAYATSPSALKDQTLLDDLKVDDLDKLTDDLTKLTDGMNDLLNGVDELDDGAKQLDSGASDLQNGASKLDSGAGDLQSGASKLNDGASTLKDGAAQLYSGTGTLKSGLDTLASKNDQLNSGMTQVADGVLKLVNTYLKEQGLISEDMTWNNYATVMQTLIGVDDTMLQKAKQEINATAGNLSEENLNALIYLAAQIGANNTESAKAALVQAGDMMKAAQAAAAEGGSIYNAQAALTAAQSDPLQVNAVKAVLPQVSYQTVKSQLVAQGAGENADLILVFACNSLMGGSETDLTTALKNASVKLTSVVTAQTELAAVGSAGSVESVQKVAAMQQMDGATLYAYLKQNYLSAYDDATASLVVVLACDAMVAGTETEVAAALGNAGKTAAAASQAKSDLTAVIAAGGNAMQVTSVATVMNSMNSTTYQTIAQQLASNFGVTDASTQALLIVMACQAMAAGTATDMTSALTAAGSTATNASNVQTALAVANDSTNAEAQNKMKAFLLVVLSDSTNSLKDLLTLLTGITTLKTGISDYTAGVTKADKGAADLYSGTKTLYDGTVTLKNGTSELFNGTVTLKNGTSELFNGTVTLKNGTSKLANGTKELSDGVNKLDKEGISKISDSISTDDLKTLKEMVDTMKQRLEDYTNYSGAPDGASTQTSFVMKTAVVVEDDTSADTTDAADTTDTTTENPGFFQRIVNLVKDVFNLD